MRRNRLFINIFLILASMVPCATAFAASTPATQEEKSTKKEIKKILFIGDSMTGWMAERLNAYGIQNGFEVATVVWDGSTIAKWGGSSRLKSIVAENNPDVIFVSLGMNELFEKNPSARLKTSLNNIVDAFGKRPYLWIGPPSWPGNKQGDTLDDWLENELGKDSYFSSFNLSLPRQSAKNPHPTKEGIKKWIDNVVKWIPENTSLEFKSLDLPAGVQMSRGKVFIYRRMKESL